MCKRPAKGHPKFQCFEIPSKAIPDDDKILKLLGQQEPSLQSLLTKGEPSADVASVAENFSVCHVCLNDPVVDDAKLEINFEGKIHI